MKKRFLIVDAHEDIAENILTFGRDYSRSVKEIRQFEKTTETPERNGNTLLGWDVYQEGAVAIVFSTLFAAPERCRLGNWDLLCYSDRNEAHNLYLKQVTVYQELVRKHPEKFQLILSKSQLRTHMESWDRVLHKNNSDQEVTQPPVGLVLLIEGGEGIRHPDELEAWWNLGVRIIGPAWASTRFCGGTNEPGPLTDEGYALLIAMAEVGFILDISHMDQVAALQAIDTYPKSIIASHSNAKALLRRDKSNRFLSDEVITQLFERDGVVGVVPYNEHLRDGWKVGDPRNRVPLSYVVDQIDYYCQMAGDAHHTGIGTDFDGGFGLESAPYGLDSIADLQKLAPLLERKGYSEEDIKSIFGSNWLRCLEKTLPE